MKGTITLQPLREGLINKKGHPVFGKEEAVFGHIKHSNAIETTLQDGDKITFDDVHEFMVKLEDDTLVELNPKNIDEAIDNNWWDYYSDIFGGKIKGRELDFKVSDGVATVVVKAIEMGETERGFGLGEFVDQYGVKCSIQSSSVATKACIWLGPNEIGLKHFKAGEGWKDVELVNTIEEHYSSNTRMHLSREDVKKLLPLLTKFAETGKLH